VWVIRFALAAVGALVLSRLLLLHVFAGRERATGGLEQITVPEALLLPSQEADLNRLRDAILASQCRSELRLIQMLGRWGEGKSFLARRLPTWLEKQNSGDHVSVSCVVVDVWKYETEPKLHLAIVEEILSHRAFLYPYGWLLYPFTLVAARLVRNLHLEMALRGSKAAIDVPFAPPHLFGQRALERMLRRAQRRRYMTVVVLDEVDRAAPNVAQAALALMHRALDQPGVVVVLVYVPEMIQFKAFNPLVPALPDIESTMQAVLYAQLCISKPGPIVDWDGTYEDSSLATTLRTAFATSDADLRGELVERFSEKYLGTSQVRLSKLSHEDVTVILMLPVLSTAVERLRGIPPARDHELRTALTTALTRWKEWGYQAAEAPTVRVLLGELFRHFDTIPNRSEGGGYTAEFVAKVVLAAFDAAGVSEGAGG
jgi:hypothetical protein